MYEQNLISFASEGLSLKRLAIRRLLAYGEAAMNQPLPATSLIRRCNPESLSFQTSDDLPDLPGGIGQERAEEAASFGLGMRSPGYNVFILGPTGSGRRHLILQLLDERRKTEPTPGDLVYVHNFDQPHRPHLLVLPAGMGTKLRDDMRHLLDELRREIPAAFESDEYRARYAQIEQEFAEQQARSIEEISREAGAEKIALIRTPAGFSLAPLAPQRPGEVITPDEYIKLPEEERQRLETVVQRLQTKLEEALHHFHVARKEQAERMRALNEEAMQFAVGHSMTDLRKQYADLPEVIHFLLRVQKDAVENMQDFRRTESGPGQGQPPDFTRYEVNVLVDHTSNGGAPVIYEESPTYQNLIGRVEYLSQFGALLTNFTLIKAGALHRAMGGYLILDARKLLTQPFAWEALKRTLSTGEIRIESPGQAYGLISTVSLEPQPAALDVKVVLVGDRWLYYMLSAYDPEFRGLFKIQADMEDEIQRDGDAHMLLCRFAATILRRERLLPFDRTAFARLIDRSARMAEDQDRLAIHAEALSDLVREAHHVALSAKDPVVSAGHVDTAIAARERRTGRIRERSQEQIVRGVMAIATSGAVPGQINGLSVLSVGESAFALPTRITASAHPGDGQIIDIQREVKMGGPIHSKGVMILSSFLARHFGQGGSLALSASLVFEQTYGGVEGDSASVAELCAILSAISGVPIRQDLAVTGSVDQFGTVQAIGGVNEKIEGFFDICRTRGLTGRQGVIIPATNVAHLMLRDDVVKAAEQGQFHIYGAAHLGEALELLTDMPSGMGSSRAASDGTIPEFEQGTLFRLVQNALHAFAERRRAATQPPGKFQSKPGENGEESSIPAPEEHG